MWIRMHPNKSHACRLNHSDTKIHNRRKILTLQITNEWSSTTTVKKCLKRSSLVCENRWIWLLSEWTLSMVKVSHALNHHWCKTGYTVAYYLNLIEACGVQRFHSQVVCARDQFCQSHICGSHQYPDCLWVSGSTGVTYFQPCFPGQDLLAIMYIVS